MIIAKEGTFSWALEKLKYGEFVRIKGAPNVCIVLINAIPPDKTGIGSMGHLAEVHRLPEGKVVHTPWTPSHEELLTDEWEVVPRKHAH